MTEKKSMTKRRSKSKLSPPMKVHMTKTEISIQPWHREWNLYGPGKMVIARTFQRKKNPSWYKPWEYVYVPVGKENITIVPRKKSSSNKTREKVYLHQKMKNDYLAYKEGNVVREKPSVRNEAARVSWHGID
jgi:hypothetical protein